MPKRKDLAPQNIEAEKSLLGSILIDNSAMDAAVGVVSPDDFYRSDHERVYRAMQALHSAGEPIDLITLGDQLKTTGDLDRIGGPAYLAALMNEVPTAVHAAHYAEIVADKALARRVIAAAGKIAAAGYEDANNPDELMSRVQAITYEVVNSTRQANRVYDPATLAAEFMEYVEKARTDPDAAGLPTGFGDLDDLIGGLRRGEVTVIAARPSVGKTALGECIAEHVAGQGKFVVFTSLEMTRQQLLARRAARYGHLPARQLMRGEIPEKSDRRWWDKLQAAMRKVAKSGVWLIDNPNATTSTIRADLNKARLRRGSEIDLIVIDYLQLLKDHAGRENDNSRIEYISNQVKAISREFECPVLLLSQLSRGVEYRKGKDSRLADLRGSGAIEQDADVVMVLERRDGEDGVRDRRTKVKVLKNRNGETGIRFLTFRPDYVQFVPAAPEPDDPSVPFEGREAA